MTATERNQFRNALRVAIRRGAPGEVTIEELVVQMKCAGFPTGSAELIREAIRSFQDKALSSKVAGLLSAPEAGNG